jgi:hypothetical protein
MRRSAGIPVGWDGLAVKPLPFSGLELSAPSCAVAVVGEWADGGLVWSRPHEGQVFRSRFGEFGCPRSARSVIALFAAPLIRGWGRLPWSSAGGSGGSKRCQGAALRTGGALARYWLSWGGSVDGSALCSAVLSSHSLCSVLLPLTCADVGICGRGSGGDSLTSERSEVLRLALERPAKMSRSRNSGRYPARRTHTSLSVRKASTSQPKSSAESRRSRRGLPTASDDLLARGGIRMCARRIDSRQLTRHNDGTHRLCRPAPAALRRCPPRSAPPPRPSPSDARPASAPARAAEPSRRVA